MPVWCLARCSLHLMGRWIALQSCLAITYRDGASIKNTGPHHHSDWHQEGHLVIKFCYNWIYEMAKIVENLNCINRRETFQSKDVMHSRTNVICRPSHTVIQWAILESKFVDLQAFRANIGALRGSSGELVGMYGKKEFSWSRIG